MEETTAATGAVDKKQKIMFLNVLAMGHIANTMPLVRALVESGHEVRYWSGENFGEVVESRSGATFCCYPNVATEVTRRTPVEHDVFYVTRFNPGKSGMLCLQPAAVALLPSLLEAAEEFQPDLIIYDLFAVWGNYLSQITGIPCVSTMCTLVQDDDELQRMADSDPNMRPNDINHDAVRVLREQFGIETAWERAVSTYCETNLVFSLRSLQTPVETQGGLNRFSFVGPLIDPAHEATLAPDEAEFITMCHERRRRYHRVVYVSMGTVVLPETRFWHLLRRSVEGKNILLVVSLGRSESGPLDSLGDQVIQARTVPQLAVLGLADVFVNHGGINSVNEAVLCGVPMVCVPHFLDQFDVANQVEDVGVGLMLDSLCVTQELLEESLRQVLEEQHFRDAIRCCREQTLADRKSPQEVAQELVLAAAVGRRGGGGS